VYVLIILLQSLVIHKVFDLTQCTGLAKAKMNKILCMCSQKLNSKK